MITKFGILILTVSTSLNLACGRTTASGVSTSGTSINNGIPPMSVSFSFDEIQAGVDYPTEIPLPNELANKKILVIQNVYRVVVPAASTLTRPVAGIDYPTEMALSPADAARPVLVLGDEALRLKLDVFNSKTMGAPMELFISGQRSIPLTNLHAIDRAAAGVDFPIGSPQSIRVVVITNFGDRILP